MKDLKAYKIEIFGLSNNTHDFNFAFNDDFFNHFEHSLVSKGKGTCAVILTKTDSMITLNLKIDGSIELECDRSLALFDFPISINKEIIYKYGDEEKELSEDVFVILKGEQEINIASFLYESISLEVPMKKLHPKFQNDSESDEMIYVSGADKESQEESIDPRWEALKKLK
ncbi:YceD family protein [Ekhidna sp. To15]|uniref:YceD family protein n=1 Tax=Ekhidna sp. To15 TaxID=3395267 RepID=UPI003F51FD39